MGVSVRALGGIQRLLRLQKQLKISFGLKLFTSVVIVFIPGFFFGKLPLSFALLFGLFGWLIAEPPVCSTREYFRTAIATSLAFLVGGLAFNVIVSQWGQMFFVITYSSFAVYVSSKWRLQSAGFAVAFIATCYMAVQNYLVSGSGLY